MHGHAATEDEPMADMNLIPLIDIALTLLIIMMVTTVFIRHPGVSLKLPETVTREGAPETKKDMTIVVAATGDVYVDAVKQTPAQLNSLLRVTAAKSKESRILLKGDRDVPYSKIMDVMDSVRQAGLTRVVLPTDPKTPGYARPISEIAPAPASAGSNSGPPGHSSAGALPASSGVLDSNPSGRVPVTSKQVH